MAADDDAVGMLEVADRRAFAQEFGIGRHAGPLGRALFRQDPRDFVAGPHRDGRFGDDHRRSGQRPRKLAHRFIDERQIGMPVAAPRRRSDRDEHGLCSSNAAGEIDGKAEPSMIIAILAGSLSMHVT